MFNRKKKQWYNNKPNYKKNNQGSEQNSEGINAADNTGQKTQPEIVKEEAQSAPPQAQPAAPQQDQKSPAAAQVKAAPAPENSGQEAPKAAAVDVECTICKMPIRNHYTAVRHKESGSLVHFDCVLRELSKENSSKLGKFRRIYYIGAGNFAIVKEFFDKRGHLKSYEIIEKIMYENKD